MSAEVAEETRSRGGLAELYERHAPVAGRLVYPRKNDQVEAPFGGRRADDRGQDAPG